MHCTCNKTLPLPCCITNLTIGTASPDTNYLVIFKTPDGRTDVLPATSTNTGAVIIQNGEYRTGTVYEIWLSPITATGIEQRQAFAIGEVEVECVTQLFEYCNTPIANQSITLV